VPLFGDFTEKLKYDYGFIFNFAICLFSAKAFVNEFAEAPYLRTLENQLISSQLLVRKPS